MPRLPHTLLLVLLFAAASVHAVGLPDTGQDACYSNIVVDGVVASNTTSIARDAGSHPRQDCRYGRDAATAAGVLTKTGAGAKGFDYSKIANDGSVLAAGATLGTNSTVWACTKDNITGLTWEVKTASGLRNNALGIKGQTTISTTPGTPPFHVGEIVVPGFRQDHPAHRTPGGFSGTHRRCLPLPASRQTPPLRHPRPTPRRTRCP